CEKGTISNINVDFGSIDAIRIQTMEQVEKYNATEFYEIQNPNDVSEFVSMFRTAEKIGKAKEPFALGDGVIILASKGSNLYAIRYYMDKKELLDLHKGISYQFPDGLEQLLSKIEDIPKGSNDN
ncbi:hypothetical protein, partial [Brevibacillus massiliensis]|uniref:hypothetical protein n=1 Tax=Brevibacillus massiliensis TaxID=1118054 RepID=UPI00047456E2